MKIIEVFADIWCPFAHVGIRCVVGRITSRGEDAVCTCERGLSNSSTGRLSIPHLPLTTFKSCDLK